MEVRKLFTCDSHLNWFYDKYYAAGSNSRYFTFQVALNLLTQRKQNSYLIVETGCQRQKDDLGAGMSTSIFAEWGSMHNGYVISVDNYLPHLEICLSCVEEWKDNVSMVLSDSVEFLGNCDKSIDLLYLDSLDYPISENADNLGMIQAAQSHCLNEFMAIENKLQENTIVLIDDNQLPRGGKPKLLKQYLAQRGWVLLLDFQQSLWVRQL